MSTSISDILSQMLSGGRPGLTTKLRNDYTKYAIQNKEKGSAGLDWPAWLKENGYELGKDGLVITKPLTGKSLREEN